ncbi:hypothetical protein [Streptomyces sp. NPDC004830]
MFRRFALLFAASTSVLATALLGAGGGQPVGTGDTVAGIARPLASPTDSAGWS